MTSVSRAEGSAASGSPPWARIMARQMSMARPDASTSAGSSSSRPAAASISRARTTVSSTTSGGPPPASTSTASRTSKALPTVRPSGVDMSVSSATVRTPSAVPSSTMAWASSAAGRRSFMNAPEPTFTSSTNAPVPSALVLDVKVGSGAFMKDRRPAAELAQAMVELGTAEGVRTVALLTDMSTPLGLTVGNALEVREAVEVLAGGGPPDVVELTVALAGEMLAAAGVDDHDPADVLASGRAMDVWRRMIRAQGGDPDAPLPSAHETEVISADADGVLTSLDARAVGE